MSLSRRLLDLARANLNALLDRAGSEGSLEELSDEELEAELERRRERRLREQEERRSREAAEEEARERARRTDGARRPRSGAAGSGPGGAGASSSSRARGSTAGQNRRPAAVATLGEQHLRELYLQLEVPYGAPFDEVKKSFRRLMRKYHPDLHVGDPKKHQVATELTMSLTQAYKELEAHLAAPQKRTRRP